MPADNAQATISLPNEAYLLPQSVPMWPPVWWVWLIVAAIVLFFLGVFVYIYRRHKKRAYRHEALANIKKAALDNEQGILQDKDCILLCHEMIRRCLISENKAEMAALPSTSLLEKIDLTMPKKHQFASLGNAFFDGPYRHNVELTAEQRKVMFKTTGYWIRKHHA